MKTERRHELQHNVLADWLGLQIERFAPYGRVAAGVAIAVVVLIGLYSYMQTQSTYRNEQGWQRYFAAMDEISQRGDAEPLAQLAESGEFVGTPVGNWAALSLADHHLQEGISQLFTDRAAAAKSLRSAVDGYNRLIERSRTPMLEERAALGAGRAYESLNELDKARAAYESLATKSGPLAAEAQQRLRDIGREPTKRFYDWFFAATPPRQGLGGPGMPGMRPDFGNLPDESGFKSSATDSGSLLSTPAPKPSEGASPAEGSTPTEGAATETPAQPDAPADAGATPSSPSEAAAPSETPEATKPAEPSAEKTPE
jgi:tetratricopeptide (TPR) repeat protein